MMNTLKSWMWPLGSSTWHVPCAKRCRSNCFSQTIPIRLSPRMMILLLLLPVLYAFSFLFFACIGCLHFIFFSGFDEFWYKFDALVPLWRNWIGLHVAWCCFLFYFLYILLFWKWTSCNMFSPRKETLIGRLPVITREMWWSYINLGMATNSTPLSGRTRISKLRLYMYCLFWYCINYILILTTRIKIRVGSWKMFEIKFSPLTVTPG